MLEVPDIMMMLTLANICSNTMKDNPEILPPYYHTCIKCASLQLTSYGPNFIEREGERVALTKLGSIKRVMIYEMVWTVSPSIIFSMKSSQS